MRNEIRNKIIATVLIVFMMVSAIPVYTYAGGNQKVYNNDNGSEERQNDGQEEDVTEENNFVYDILDEMLEEVEKEETERIEENVENEGISLLWGNSKKENEYGHYSSSDYAGNYVKLDVKTVEKLRKAAIIPDKLDDDNPTNDFYFPNLDSDAFHGRGNYVANISYMWELAQELGINSDKKAALAKVEKNATTRYKLKLTAKDWTILKELMNNMDGILAINMFSGTESDKKSRKYKVLGLAMHMIGDTCAHRTMVPLDAIHTIQNVKNYKGVVIDYKNHFSFTTKTVTTSDLKLWMKNAREKAYENKIRANATWNVFQQAVKTGCMEFRDIKHFTSKSSAGVYEDNAYFYPVRYTITKNSCVRLLNASSLSASRKIVVPRTHFIVFNNLKGYYVKAGGSTSDFDYWKKISTDGFV